MTFNTRLGLNAQIYMGGLDHMTGSADGEKVEVLAVACHISAHTPAMLELT